MQVSCLSPDMFNMPLLEQGAGTRDIIWELGSTTDQLNK